MNLQQLIDNRDSLNQLQLTALTDMLGYKQSKQSKVALKAAIKNRFYSIFDGNSFAKKFELHNEFVEFTGSDAELKAIRMYILSVGDVI